MILFRFWTDTCRASLGLCGFWVVLALGGGIAGCGGSSGSSGGGASSGVSVSGTVSGGTSGIAGARVSIWQAGSGFGTGAIELSSSTSDANGAFTAKSIECASPDAFVYATAVGGDAGAGLNPAIGLMTAIGRCGDVPQFGAVAINELTTIAAQWALGQFIDKSGEIAGAPSSDGIGLQNAIALAANNLVNPNTGQLVDSLASIAPQCGASPAPVACGTLEKLNTLADILAACVESAGFSSAGCGNLFANSGAAPSDTTLAAAHAMATSMRANAAQLFSILGSIANLPFTPILQSAPVDLLLSINYTAAGLSGPRGIAIDGLGNAWIANGSGASVTELSSLGAQTAQFTGGGLNAPADLAIDQDGNVWVTNSGGDSITFIPASSPSSPRTFTGGGLGNPKGIAIDIFGIAWVANAGNGSISAFCGAIPSNCPQGSQTGTALSPAGGYVGGGLDAPQDVALDNNGNVWAANCGRLCDSRAKGDGSISEFCGFVGAAMFECGGAAAGAPLSPQDGFIPFGIRGPSAIEVDNGFDVFVPNVGGNSMTFFPGADSTLKDSITSDGGGLLGPDAIALDGSNFAWIVNPGGGEAGSGSISYFSGATPENPPGALAVATPISPEDGFVGAGLRAPAAIAIDSSGNVWVTNAGNNSVTEFIGAAIPIRTPSIGPSIRP